MKLLFCTAAAAASLFCALHTASAQEAVVAEVTTAQVVGVPESDEGYVQRSVRAPRKAFELTIDTGYTQGFGSIGEGRRVNEVAGPGVGVGLGLAYRASPKVSVGVSGRYQEVVDVVASDVDQEAAARGLAGGLDMTYHFTPYDRFDLWTKVGAGYRFLWDVRATPERTLLRHGFELAKLEVGFDWRLSRSFAIGPLFGADVTMLLWRDDDRFATEDNMMAQRGIATFLHAGLQARFDIGGPRSAEPKTMARR